MVRQGKAVEVRRGWALRGEAWRGRHTLVVGRVNERIHMAGGDATEQNVTGLGDDGDSVKKIREGKAKQQPHTQTYEQGSGDKEPPHSNKKD